MIDSIRIPVECIAIMNHKEIRPLRIRYEVKDESIVVKIDRILQRDKKNVRQNMNQSLSIEHMFRCESIQGDTRKPFQLIFNTQLCRWHMLT